MAVLNRVVAAVFRAGSWARRAPVLHPRGTVFTATLDVPGTGPAALGVPLLDEAGRHPALVRVSKGAGTPDPLPDLIGLAVRVLGDGADPTDGTDLLFDSSGAGVLTRHLLAPARDVASATYSTLLPYRAGGRLVVVGVRPAGSRRRVPPSARDLPAALPAARPVFEVVVAPLLARWTPVARLELGEPLPAGTVDLAFDPDGRAPAGLVPAGWLQRLRGPAYRASQRGRAARRARPARSARPARWAAAFPARRRGAVR